MFQKKNANELIARYGLDFENYSDEQLKTRNKQDLEMATIDQSRADKSVTPAQVALFGQAHSHQNWVAIRQNEQIIRLSEELTRQNEQIIRQNKGLAHQNQCIIDLLKGNNSD